MNAESYGGSVSLPGFLLWDKMAENGMFCLCSSLQHPDTVYDLRTGTLAEAWCQVVPRVRDMRSTGREFLTKCRPCPIINLRLWCPAHAYLERGKMDAWCEYFCQVAHARAEAVEQRVKTAAG